MRRSRVLTGCTALLLACSTSNAALAAVMGTPEVDLDTGRIRGALEQGVAAFKGIPYAAPPVGALRWRPTQPAAPWRGVRDTVHFGAACPQPVRPDTGTAPELTSEDCLTVNLWTPDLAPARLLPVMVWVHGGAYFLGSGRQMLDEGPPELVRSGVVLVSFNYRIGRLGFFAHPALTSEVPVAATANYWLMDQVAALQWVARNVGAFGGDPANVTIFGVSAGGSSVNALMATRAARGLFHRAIAQSGGGLLNAGAPLAQAEQAGLDFARRAGVEGTGPAALARLRDLSPAQLLAAEQGPPAFGAVIDGTWLAASLATYFARGDIARVPYLAGTTSDEFSVFGLMGLDAQSFERRFDVNLDEVRPAYERDGPVSDGELIRQAGADAIFTTGAHGLARLVARTGTPAYTYRFAFLPEGKRDSLPGVPHGGDQPYLFGLEYALPGEPRPVPAAADLETARLVHGWWSNFARTGDPNGPGLPHWPRCDATCSRTLVIDQPTRVVEQFREAPLAAWFGILERRSRIDVP